MTDEIKTEAEKIEADAKADATKIKNVWQSHEIYFVMAIAFVAGAILGHLI
jgi:hypothetical protein